MGVVLIKSSVLLHLGSERNTALSSPDAVGSESSETLLVGSILTVDHFFQNHPYLHVVRRLNVGTRRVAFGYVSCGLVRDGGPVPPRPGPVLCVAARIGARPMGAQYSIK